MSETKHTTNLEARSYEEPAGHTVWAVRTEWRDKDGRRCTAWPAVCDCADLPNEANAKLYAAAPTMAAYLKKRADLGDEEAASILEEVHATR